MYYYNGGGIGVADLNGDGLTDVILGSNLGSEKVFLNKGNLQFEDISSAAQIDGGAKSWTNGIAIADINGDGLLDVYLSQVGTYRNLDCENKLFVCTKIDKEGRPHYREAAEEYGLAFKGFSTQASFFDYDLDGDLDMFLMNHSLHHNGTFGQRKEFLGTYSEVSGDRFYRNDGNTFVDITKTSGIHSSVIGYGLGLAVGDVNNDGYPDIYIGNDFHENDYLYINQKDGTFKDELESQIKHTSRFSMGVDIADVNNDGLQDIIALDMLPEDPVILKSSEGEDALDIFNFKLGYGYNHQYARNTFQLNQGNDSYKEVAAYSGIHATDWSWTPLFFDMNMDGKKDIFITNGIPKRMNDIDYINFISGNDVQYKIQFDELEEQDLSTLDKIPEIKLHNKFYLGSTSLKFKDLKNSIVKDQVSYSNSAAYADFDNDGDYDLICNNIDQNAFLYENLTSEASSIRVKLQGPDKNRHGIGAKITAQYANKTISQEYYSTRGFQSSMVNQILLPADSLETVTVSWPGGKSETRTYHSDSLAYLFAYTKASNQSSEQISTLPIQPLGKDITAQLNLNYLHKENSYVEFNREPLIPTSTSAEGPALAVGDVNGDGLEDMYVGSAKRKRNQLYLQQKDGTFSLGNLTGPVTDTIYEEVDAEFVDIDRDGDLDLIIATGGNEYRLNSPYTQPLLYRNEKGTLTRDEQVFSEFNVAASDLVLLDLNKDGHDDIFLAARAQPRSYGGTPASLLLMNDGKGNFSDVTDDWSDVLGQVGMVTAAVSKDIDADGRKDLILALEWGEIIIFRNEGDHFSDSKLTARKGWWKSLLIVDFDNDGDLDVFAGNLGLNARLKASKAEPLRMYYADFDDNGLKEQLLTYYVDGRELPFSNMMELQKQIPSLKKKFLYAKDFANTSVENLFGKEKIEAAKLYETDWLENSYFENTGAGKFELRELPMEMQYTSFNTATAIDLNGDSYLDIVPGGNYHYCNVQMGRYDAENGSYLLNQGGKEFTYQSIGTKPLQGQVRKIRSIDLAGRGSALVFTQNNDSLKVLQLKNNFE